MSSSNIGRILNFRTFLNESEQNGVKRVIMLSSVKEEDNKTAKPFREECDKRGLELFVVNINQMTLDKLYHGHLIKDNFNTEEIIINPETTVIVPRMGVVPNQNASEIMRELQNARYFCLNSIEAIEICENKFLTSKILEEHGLPVPRYSLMSDVTGMDDAIKAIGGKFPIVMKLLSGSQGIGVSIIDSKESLKSVFQTIQKLEPKKEVLLQEKIESDFDLRIQILLKKFDPLIPAKDNCKVLGDMRRDVIKGDFRSNYSLGGEVEKYDLEDDLADLACRAANAVGCHWSGVDIMIDKNTKKPYILEVNSSPGTEGIIKVEGESIIGPIIDFLVDSENWTYSNMEAGYLENITIPGIGNMVAKLDTGNGTSASSLHADSLKIVDNKVIWRIGKVETASELIRYANAEVGNSTQKRPVIKLDIQMGNIYKKDVELALVDRTSKSTPILLNRKMMRELGLTVNPHKAFVVSEKPEGYTPKEGKGDRHGGIEFKQ